MPEENRRTRIVLWLAGLPALAALCLLAVYALTPRDRTTVTSLSPDGSVGARLVETSPTWHFDRNFQVRLEDARTGKTHTIFRSPDEGRPAGTERFLWSKDGTALLLTGHHFYCKTELPVAAGGQAYFLFHLPSRRAWCNADQGSSLPALTVEILRKFGFAG